jgi:hypothetical protein
MACHVVREREFRTFLGLFTKVVITQWLCFPGEYRKVGKEPNQMPEAGQLVLWMGKISSGEEMGV